MSTNAYIKKLTLFLIILVVSVAGFSCASSKYKLKPISFNSDTVIMYSASWCGACKKAKRFLNDNYISYVELDYENEKEFNRLLAYAHKIDYRGVFESVPVFVVRGKILIGYDPETILMILGTPKE